MKNRFYFWIFLCFSLSVPIVAQMSTQTFTGAINNEVSYVQFPLTITQPNTTLTLDLKSTSGDLDTYLYLVDSKGNIVDENDDYVRGYPDSFIEFAFAPVGQYAVVATRYGAQDGETAGKFVLNVDQQPSLTPVPIYDVSAESLAAQGFPNMTPRPKARWTIIAYYGADNNLEEGLLQDMKEFENAGGSTEDVRIIVLMDRSRGNFVSPKASQEWSTAKIFEMQSNLNADGSLIEQDTTVYNSTELADLGANPNGASGQLLAQYLTWAIQTYPAEQYAIAFGSHGAGWEGLLQDDTPTESDEPSNDNSESDVIQSAALMTIPQLQVALRTVQKATNQIRFAVLINDACSMSSVEYYSAMSEFFDWSLASPEVVVNPALDMGLLTRLLNQQTDIIDSSRQLIDQYIDQDIYIYDTPDVAYLNHAVTDLTRFDAVRQAIDEFARVFNNNPAAYAPILGQARMDDTTYVYSSFMGRQSKVDVGYLMQNVIRYSIYPELANAAAAVIEKLDDARVYGKSGGAPELANASYYNIYFPSDRAYYRGGEYLAKGEFSEWGLLLRNYFNASNPSLAMITGSVASNFHPPVAPKINISSIFPLDGTGSVLSPIVLEGEIIGRNIDHAEITIDQKQADGTYIRLSTEPFLLDVPTENGIVRLNRWESGVDIRQISWDVTLPQIVGASVDGDAIPTFEYMSFTDTIATLNGAYREPKGSVWHDVTLIFDNILGTGLTEGTVQRVLSSSATTDAIANVVIPVGSEFVAFRPRVSADGVFVLERSPNKVMWDEGGITYRFAPAPDGDYQIGIFATAVGGSTGFEKRDVRVNNSDIDSQYRADTSPFAGFTLPRGRNWQRMIYSSGSVGECTTSPIYPNNLELYRNELVEFGDAFTRVDQPLAIGNLSVYLLLQPYDQDGTVIPLDNPLTLADIQLQLQAGGLRITRDGLSATTFADKPAFSFRYEYDTPQGLMLGVGYAVENGFEGTIQVFSAEILEGSDLDLTTQETLLQTYTQLFDVEDVYAQQTRIWGFVGFPDYTLTLYGKNVDDADYWTLRAEDDTFQRYSDASLTTFLQINRQEIDTRATVVSLGRRLARDGATDFVVTEENVLLSPSVAWESMSYTAMRDGQAVQGRVYRTFENGAMYTLWFELPTDDNTIIKIANILEPIVDSVVFLSVSETGCP